MSNINKAVKVVDGYVLMQDGTVYYKKAIDTGFEKIPGISGVVDLTNHFVLKSNRKVYIFSQEGLGIQIAGLSGITAFSNSGNNYLGLTSRGDVWTWNDSYWYYAPERIVPTQIPGLTDVKAIAVGGWYHYLAVKTDGTVWGWGSNSSGQLGTGNTTAQPTPVQIAGLADIASIVTTISSSFALKADGTVWGWGSNSAGQLGIGNTTDQLSPVQIPGLTDIASIAPTNYNSFAVSTEGIVWAWGANWNGELGIGNTTNQSSPVQISTLSNVTSVSVSSRSFLAVQADGSVWSWGYNDIESHDTPIRILTEPSAEKVFITSDELSYAITQDGNVYCWGRNYDGYIDGQNMRVMTPVLVFPSTCPKPTGLSATHNASYALLPDKTVCKVGEGETVSTQVAGLSYVKAIAANWALKEDGTVWYIVNGQAYEYTEISGCIAISHLQEWNDQIYQIHLLKSDGTVWVVWDRCNYDEYMYMDLWQVDGLSDVTAIASGKTQALVLKSDGTVCCLDWGGWYSGTPIMTNVTSVIAGGDYGFAVKTDGSIWNCFGEYAPFQFQGSVSAVAGNVIVRPDGTLWECETIIENNTPAIVTSQLFDQDNVEKIVSSSVYVEGDHYLILQSTGEVYGWGCNRHCQLGLPFSLYAPPTLIFDVSGCIPEEPEDNGLGEGEELDLTLTEGKTEYVTIACESVVSFEDVEITLEYDPVMLAVNNIAAQIIGNSATSGQIPETYLDIHSHQNGQVVFSVTKQVPDEKECSGLVTLIEFTALQTGPTTLRFC